jgi:hypothetical protein
MCLRLNFQCHYPDQKTTGAYAIGCPGGSLAQSQSNVTDTSGTFARSVMSVHSELGQQILPRILQFSHIPSMELAMIGDVVSRVEAMHETDTLSIYWGTKLLPE